MKNDETLSSRSRLLRLGGIVAELALGAAFVGVVYLHDVAPGTRAASVREASGGSVASSLSASCGTATVCLTDDRTGDRISFTCPGGAYTFKGGSPLITLTGMGSVNTVNGTETLTDNKPDRRITAGLLLSQGTGRAVIYFILAPGIIQTLSVNQTIPFRACASNGLVAPAKPKHHKHH